MLSVFIAQDDAAASYAAACGLGIAAAALRLPLPSPPLLGCRYYSFSVCVLFFVFCVCLPRCRISPLPSFLSEASLAEFDITRWQTNQDHDGKAINMCLVEGT